MPRNVERDIREEERRRRQILAAGFKLFSEKGIENISLQAVADAADVGIATLYNYYQNKVKLCIAISAEVWKKVLEENIGFKDGNIIVPDSAYELVELYFDLIIKMYKETPEVLRYSGNYKTFICRENVKFDMFKEQFHVLKPVTDMFHIAYEKAKVDKSIRTDIPESEMITTVALSALGMAERYAQGLVWNMNEKQEYTNELLHLKNMMLAWIKG